MSTYSYLIRIGLTGREEILGNARVWTTWGKDSWWGVLLVYKAKSVINVESKLRTAKWQADEQKGL